MKKLNKKFVIFFIDIDPDEGNISQMKPVAYTEHERFTQEIVRLLNSADDGGDGSREYKYISFDKVSKESDG